MSEVESAPPTPPPTQEAEPVLTSREGAVLTITLNRPDKLNAFNADLHKGLAAALREARAEDIRAVVITGAGRGFCVGQDLTEFREAPDDIADRLRGSYHPNILAIRSLEKPVIAAVNGAAAGAGLSLACACDLRIAADSATFVPAFINIGLIPDSGGSFFIHRLLGNARAFEWMASGRRLTAARAHAWGLVNEVVEDEELPVARGRGGDDVRRSSDARRGHDEAPLRRSRLAHARGAARAGGPDAVGRDEDRRLSRGRGRIPGEARSALQRALGAPRADDEADLLGELASLGADRGRLL